MRGGPGPRSDSAVSVEDPTADLLGAHSKTNDCIVADAQAAAVSSRSASGPS
jgi:hypothetical protein